MANIEVGKISSQMAMDGLGGESLVQDVDRGEVIRDTIRSGSIVERDLEKQQLMESPTMK